MKIHLYNIVKTIMVQNDNTFHNSVKTKCHKFKVIKLINLNSRFSTCGIGCTFRFLSHNCSI